MLAGKGRPAHEADSKLHRLFQARVELKLMVRVFVQLPGSGLGEIYSYVMLETLKRDGK